ncbi:MAG: ATP-dependent helicase [Muribaculaceae bacterium]
MEEYLDKLNPQQRQAVEYLDGPELVIAGAGSGKTRVLTYKIVHLLAKGYEPWRIMALTFTNKAAREMRERIEELVGQKTSSKLWMGTFHSMFLRILRTNADLIGFKRDFTIYETADSKSLLKMIIKDMQLDEKLYNPTTVFNAISFAKNALYSPEAYRADADLMRSDKNARRPHIVDIYTAYRDRCRIAGAMDFDDLLFYTNVLLSSNPGLLNHYREYFRYLLVDEYQDTNHAQNSIITLLTQGQGDLCVVGDDAQSIYSFRGANIKFILNLRDQYPDLKTFKLERNYRSTQNIINAANTLIDKNSRQIHKEVFSENEPGERINIVESYSDFEEGYLVANRISQVKMHSKDSYNDFAVLYRTNAQSRILEEALRKRNIPYRIYGGLAFYQRKEIKDVVAYLRLAINPDDDEAFKRVINTPARGIGETTVKKLAAAAIENNVSLWQIALDPARYQLDINRGTKAKIESFTGLISQFIARNNEGVDAETMTVAIISESRILAMYASDSTPESVSKKENIQELLNAARQFVEDKKEQGATDSMRLVDFLSEVSLATDQDEATGAEECVTLMTIHAAKGLEFDNVFIVGVEEDLLPSSMGRGSLAEVEEERRLLYVAITRAKKFCMMTYAKSRYINGQNKLCNPSRFLKDINIKYLKVGLGSQIATPEIRPSHESYDRQRVLRPISSNNAYRPAYKSDMSDRSDNKVAAGDYAQHSAAELQTGVVIEHQRFGRGVITEIDTSTPDHKITVKFDNVSTKKLLLSFAKFKILE